MVWYSAWSEIRMSRYGTQCQIMPLSSETLVSFVFYTTLSILISFRNFLYSCVPSLLGRNTCTVHTGVQCFWTLKKLICVIKFWIRKRILRTFWEKAFFYIVIRFFLNWGFCPKIWKIALLRWNFFSWNKSYWVLKNPEFYADFENPNLL